MQLYRLAVSRFLNPGEDKIQSNQYLDEKYFEVEQKVTKYFSILATSTMANTKESRELTTEIHTRVAEGLFDEDNSVAEKSVLQINRRTSFFGSLNLAREAVLFGAGGFLTKSTRAAIEVVGSNSSQKAYISGFREILSKARAAAAGDISAQGEIEAAKFLRSRGLNVYFQTPGATRSGAGGTADFLVGGADRIGKGGIPYDVYTPISNNINSVVTNLAKKNSQA